ncbi:MAG: FkbM family methyltransferase [Thermoprotei archaeon]
MGAHFGFYTLIAAIRVGPKGIVLSFGPNTYNFRVLRLNVLINRLRKAKLFKVALADRSGIAYLGIPRGRMTGENILVVEPAQAKCGEYVQLERFDNLIENLGISEVDVVKIDVEDSEYLVLEGFGEYLNRCKHIILEIHPEKIIKLRTNPKTLYRLLKRRGFNLHLLDSKHEWYP